MLCCETRMAREVQQQGNLVSVFTIKDRISTELFHVVRVVTYNKGHNRSYTTDYLRREILLFDSDKNK